MSRLLAATLVLLPSLAHAAGDESAGSDIAVRVLNLAILLGVLWVVARKPIQAFFASRRDEIAGEVEAAAKLQAEAEARHAQFQRKLVELDAELETIRSGARDRTEAEKQRILEEARAAADRIRNDARQAVDQELRRAREALRQEAADLAIELAGGILREQVSESDRSRLIDEFIGKIEQPSGGSGS